MKSVPSVRSRTVIETDTPSVLGWAGGDIGGPGVSATRPPSILGRICIVVWTAGASAICLGNVRDVDSLELLHPNSHLVGEES